MIITSVGGKQVSIIENKHGILVDTLGNWWTRDADKDTSDAAGYSNQDKEDYMQLTRPELRRVCGGNTTIQQLTTVAEMRDYTSRLEADLRDIADSWSDQQLREVLIEADDKNKSCISLLLYKLSAEYDRLHPVVDMETEECVSCQRESTSFEPEHTHGTNVPTKKKAQRKAQGYAFEGICDGVDVKLTPKQVTVMLAILRATDTELNCSTANVLREVSSEMSAISAGAVFSTLKEKGIISMDKTTGTINPTKLGAWVQVRLQEDQKEV